MRRGVVWALLVVCGWTAAASAAVTARISGIGFGSYIRSDQWVPLTVQTDSPADAAPHAYDLQVVQTDLDGDEVVYSRTGLTINPGQQTFRTYFLPESVDHGLPASGSETAADLAKRLRVFLYDPATGKRAVRVAVGGTMPQALEGGDGAPGGQKLILVAGRSPNLNEFAPGSNRVIGLAEQAFFVQTDVARLPESVIAYAAVDAVVWTDADTARLSPAQTAALRQYVTGGGTLAVVQNADAARTAKFEDMLPVKVGAVEDWDRSEPLKAILQPSDRPSPRSQSGRAVDAWRNARGPFRMARAETRPDAIVDAWTDWPDGTHTPLIARRLHGTGCVAWLAQDVTEPGLAVVDFGWPRLWERVFDWRDGELTFVSAETTASLDRAKAKFAGESVRDIGAAFVGGVNLQSKTAGLITLAFVFFVGYWLLAGPGAFFALAARKQAQLNWFVYGAIAAAATVLTILIAQLVLRGGPQIKHVSLVRSRGDTATTARVISRFGVYLPKDTNATLALPHTPGEPVAALTPLALDPQFVNGTVNPRDSSYVVPVTPESDATSVDLTVPFRSTLKKLQADWTGPVAGGIAGQAKLVEATVPIEGRLVNDTGRDLARVIMVFRGSDQAFGDAVIALPEWKKGQVVDLAATWKAAETKLVQLPSGLPGLPLFAENKPARGSWGNVVPWLHEDLRRSGFGQAAFDDADRDYYRSFPLASLFCRCPAMTNYNNESTRSDVVRSGVRAWDVSPAVAAGGLVVLAQADGPLPSPLTVDGDKPEGDGRLFYQAVIPVDRTATHHPTTEPTDTP